MDPELCGCGKPADHVNAPEDSADWACLVPNFDPQTGRRLPPVGKYAPSNFPESTRWCPVTSPLGLPCERLRHGLTTEHADGLGQDWHVNGTRRW